MRVCTHTYITQSLGINFYGLLFQVHPLFILSVADFILAILWLIGGVVWLTPDSNGWAKPESSTHTGMCYVLGVATTVSVTYMYNVHMYICICTVLYTCTYTHTWFVV